jgi:branched-chain amino acid transport system substrate-binding protein
VRTTRKSRSARVAAAAMAAGLMLAACSGAEVVEGEEDATADGGVEGDASEEEAGDGSELETDAPADEDAILIGAIHPLTGGLAEDGESMSAAVEMAIDDINEAGGIESMDGRELGLVRADSEGSAEVAQTEAQRMIDQGVSAIVGPFQSAVAVNLASLAERSQVPFVVDVAVANEVITEGSQFTFRIQPNATAMGEIGAQTLAELAESTGEEIARVVHMHDETEFGSSINSAFAAEAEQLGIEVVESISYDPFGVSDLTTELSRVDAADVDVLVATGYYGDGVLLAREAAAVRPGIKGVFGIANGAFDIDEFPGATDGAGDLYMNANYHWDANSDRVLDLRERYTERFDRPMRTAAVLAYQAVEIIAAGLEEAGDSDPAALRDGISGVSIDDPLLAYGAPIEFDETGENVNARPIVMQVQGEDIPQVFPEEFAEADLIFPGTPWDE